MDVNEHINLIEKNAKLSEDKRVEHATYALILLATLSFFSTLFFFFTAYTTPPYNIDIYSQKMIPGPGLIARYAPTIFPLATFIGYFLLAKGTQIEPKKYLTRALFFVGSITILNLIFSQLALFNFTFSLFILYILYNGLKACHNPYS